MSKQAALHNRLAGQIAASIIKPVLEAGGTTTAAAQGHPDSGARLMADHSTIEWTDATWNPVTGCSVVSPGCTNCYAMKLAGTRLKHHWSRKGLTKDTKAGPVWTGEVRFNREWLTQPLGWKKPRMIFVCAHGDLFHPDVPDAWIDQVFAVMALCPQHTFQVLTKRPERMRDYIGELRDGRRVYELACDMVLEHALRVILIAHPSHEQHAPPGQRVNLGVWPLPNVWLGTSVEDQRRADERIPHLLATPAAVRFVSAEPLLGPLDVYGGEPDPRLGGVKAGPGLSLEPWRRHDDPPGAPSRPGIDWVIVGGESGDGARPMHPDWARSLRDQCAAADVPFFFKQWGEWLPGQNDPVPNVEGGSIAHWQDGMWGDHSPRLPSGPTNYVMWAPDGTRHPGGSRSAANYFPVKAWAALVGKKAAGRLLDGVEHNSLPRTRSGSMPEVEP